MSVKLLLIFVSIPALTLLVLTIVCVTMGLL